MFKKSLDHCVPLVEPAEMSTHTWFQELGAVTVATGDMAGAYRANVAECCVATICGCFLISRDVAEWSGKQFWLHLHRYPHSAHFSSFNVQGRIEKSFHQVIRRWLAMSHLTATATTSKTTNWHLCICEKLTLLVRQSDVTPNKHRSPPTPASPSTLPTMRWIRAEQGLFQQWIWRTTMTTRILACPTSRCSFPRVQIPSNNSALVTFSQAGRRPRAKSSQFPADTKSDQSESLAITVSCYISSMCTCSSWTSRSGSIGHTTSMRSSEWSAWNGLTCSTPSTRRISCCHSATWSSCEAKPWHILTRRTQLQRADASSAKTRDIPKTRRNCYRDSLRKQIKLLKNSEQTK